MIRPPPTIGQLPSGEWAVFNCENTPLWDATFATRREAAAALIHYRTQQVMQKEAAK